MPLGGDSGTWDLSWKTSFFLSFLLYKIFYSLLWPQTCYAAEDDLEFLILLPLRCWDYRFVLPHSLTGNWDWTQGFVYAMHTFYDWVCSLPFIKPTVLSYFRTEHALGPEWASTLISNTFKYFSVVDFYSVSLLDKLTTSFTNFSWELCHFHILV